MLDVEKTDENDHTIRVTKQNFTYDDENKLTDARVERLGMKALSEPNVTTYHYEYDANGNRTTVEIKDDGLTLESTIYTYDRLNKLVSSREVTASGLYLYEYTYDDNGNLVSEDRHRQFEIQRTNIRRYEYTKDNKLESVYSGNTLLVSYTYDGDGTITSSLERDLDLNQNLNIHDTNYINSLTNNQRELINKVSVNDSFLYELTEYIIDKNRTYSETLMERDGTGQLSTVYTYGNQRINSESYNNLTGLYTYDGRGSVSAVIGGYGDFRASYWYDGLGNVKSQIHGYGAFGSGKKYYGYNAEQYNPVTGNQNLRNRQVNIRRQRFLTEDTYLGQLTDVLSINRYAYAESNPLKYKDPSGNISKDYQKNIASSAKWAIESLIYSNDILKQRGAVQLLKRATRILTEDEQLVNSVFVNENILDTIFDNDFIYYNYVKPRIDDEVDNLSKMINEEGVQGIIPPFNGGQSVAEFVHNNGSTLKALTDIVSAYSEEIKGCSRKFSDKTLKLAEIGALPGFEVVTDSSKNRIITTRYYNPQGSFGYTDIYDYAFENITGAQHDKIEIGNEYTIWIWKSGSYLGMGAGTEVGIYKGVGDVVGTTMSDNLGIDITVQMFGPNGENIVDMRHYYNSKEWTDSDGIARISNPSEPQKVDWWRTGFNSNEMDYETGDLTTRSRIDFSGSPEAMRMYDMLEQQYRNKRKKLAEKGNLIPRGNYVVTYEW